MESNFGTTRSVKIKSIKIIPNEDVYDITVADNHNFFANGLVVHNCGEQVLPVGGVCLLGSINLTQFVNEARDGWNLSKLNDLIPIAVRFMDNVNDITHVPLESQKANLKDKRRIGLGVLGYGSALLMMKTKYGSEKAKQLTDELMEFISNAAYSASSDIAAEKGSFLLFDADKYLEGEFVKVLKPETREKIRKQGLRNSHLLSIQPTGNCVPLSTKIRTEEGVKSMKEIFEENHVDMEKVGTWFVPIKELKVDTTEGERLVTGLYVNGVKETLKVQTESGKKIEGTLEHKVLVKVSDTEAVWRKLSDLKVGDAICYVPRITYKKVGTKISFATVYQGKRYQPFAQLETVNITGLNLKEERVKSITSSSNFTVDIEVYDNHHYILDNGLVSHNSSVYANNVSGGLEPLFSFEYVRTTIFPYPPEGLDVPKHVDFGNKTFQSTTPWEWTKEGDENLLFTNFGGYVWKYDQNRGLLRETPVVDYGVRDLKARNEWDPTAEWAANAMVLDIKAHVDIMAIFAKYVDSALSKTINIPSDYSYEDFKTVYSNTYGTGTIKGITTYRAGTMTSVLSETSSAKKEEDVETIHKTKAPKRPKTLKCDINHLMVNGDPWMVIVGLFGKDPYEIFAFKKNKIHLSHRWTSGELSRVRKGCYNLTIGDGDIIIEDIAANFESDEQEALTRMVSTALRHGADVGFIFEQLMKSEGTVVSFSKAVARTLKKYITEDSVLASKALDCDDCGGKETLRMQEGCYVCSNCAHSKC